PNVLQLSRLFGYENFSDGEKECTQSCADSIGASHRGHDNKRGRGRCWSLSPAESIQRPSLLRMDRRRWNVTCVLRWPGRHAIESNIGRCRGTASLGVARKPPPANQELHHHPSVELHKVPQTLPLFCTATVGLYDLPRAM